LQPPSQRGELGEGGHALSLTPRAPPH
jgi:hypothetical protein